MTAALRLKPHWDRWYDLIEHPVQVDLMNAVNNGVRFPVVPAGRRSGKSERFKRFLVKQAMKHPNEMYFAGAPTYQQVKKIFWQDLKKLAFSSVLPKSPSESDLIIFFPNGSEIHLIGFDKPERFEGVPWTGGGIDEIANIKPDAWELNISPALDTVHPDRPDYRAWCWLFGVPDGLNHFYDICEMAKQEIGGFKLFHWKSAEILPPDVIEEAKKRLSAKQFRQEYEGCHLPETQVLMADGTNKKICDVVPYDEVFHVDDDGKKVTCKVLESGKTGKKEILTSILETGESISASVNHGFKIHKGGEAQKVSFEKAEWLEFLPVYWIPTAKDEKLAALVGYMTGDGSIAISNDKYKRVDGSFSLYEKTHGAFYGNEPEDLNWILQDCKSLNMATNATVKIKKNKEAENKNYQLQIGKKDTELLIEAGAPIGKKVAMQFDVPGWIVQGSAGIKRAYLAALFGAEGTMPAIRNGGKTRMPRQPVLNMCKKSNIEGFGYFRQLQEILEEFGIVSFISKTNENGHSKYWLSISAKLDNIIKFFENFGYVYCSKKSIKAWQWVKYLKAYRQAAMFRKDTCIDMNASGEKFNDIGKVLGITKGAAWRLISDIKKGRRCTAGHNFPYFEDWVKARWDDRQGLLRLSVSCFEKKGVSEVWNLLVSSKDHSYILSSGANNFNSFETVTGRIYEDYGAANYTKEEIKPHELLHWMHDQNFTPLSSAIGVIREDKLYLLDEIVLESAISRQSAEEFVERYKDHQNKQVYVYGDPAGRAGEKHGHASDYTEIEDVLRQNGWKFVRKVKPKHPAIKDRQNAVRARICNAKNEINLFVNTQKAPYCHKGLATVQVKAGSSFLEQDSKYQHITTAIGYMIDYLWPVNSPQSTIHRIRAN